MGMSESDMMMAEQMDAEFKERKEYWKMNMEPCIKLFLVDDINEKGWTYCDMLFTYFLHNIMTLYHAHDLCMQHLQTWYRALMRDDGRDDFQLSNWGFDVPPRVRIAQKIIMEFEFHQEFAGILTKQKRYQESYDKPYNLFCACLDHIVHRDCDSLRPHRKQWDEYVVQGWFDYGNNENARVFIARAELFFKNHGKSALQYYIDYFNGSSGLLYLDYPQQGSSLSVSRCSNPYTVA